jgi:hypothetical protein
MPTSQPPVRPHRRLSVLVTELAIADGEVAPPEVGDIACCALLFTETPPDAADPSIATVDVDVEPLDDGIPLFQLAASAGFRDEERWWEWRDRARPLPGPRLPRLVPAHHVVDGRGRILDDPAPRPSRRGSSTGSGCLIPLTVNGIRRLFNRVVCPVRHTLLHVWHWSNWRRINQTRARVSQYARRHHTLSLQHQEVLLPRRASTRPRCGYGPLTLTSTHIKVCI